MTTESSNDATALPGVAPSTQTPASTPHRPTWLIAVAVVLAVSLGGGVVFAGWAVTRAVAVAGTPDPEHPAFVRDVVDVASRCAETIFSYDYRSYDQSVADGLACTTGRFRAEYRDTAEDIADEVKREHAVVRAKVKQIGVSAATTKRVTVLVFVDQYRRGDDVTGEKVDTNRVSMALVPDGGTWLVSEAKAV